MTMGFDDCSTTTIGTGVDETTLNGGNPLTTPTIANGIIEIIPYQNRQGAYTADESVFTAFRVQSDDVAVEPKRFNLPVQYGGEAAFTTVANPGLRATLLNIPLVEQSRINYLAQAQIANTVAVDVGCTVVYTDAGIGPEQFYQKADNESAGGTTINTRSTGNDITITGGSQINKLATFVAYDATAGACTASEASIGFMEFVSSDFLTSMPYRVVTDPVLVGLGTATSANVQNGMTVYNMPDNNGIPMSGRTVISTFYTNTDAKTNPDVFIGNVGFLK